MGRPRTPSNVLEMRGAFSKDPRRRRKDAVGAAEFNRSPPLHMPQGAVPAWNYLVERLPLIAFYNCDEIAVEIAARLLAAFWLNGDLKTEAALVVLLGKLGMTPGDRTKIPAKEPQGQADPADKYF